MMSIGQLVKVKPRVVIPDFACSSVRPPARRNRPPTEFSEQVDPDPKTTLAMARREQRLHLGSSSKLKLDHLHRKESILSRLVGNLPSCCSRGALLGDQRQPAPQRCLFPS